MELAKDLTQLYCPLQAVEEYVMLYDDWEVEEVKIERCVKSALFAYRLNTFDVVSYKGDLQAKCRRLQGGFGL